MPEGEGSAATAYKGAAKGDALFAALASLNGILFG